MLHHLPQDISQDNLQWLSHNFLKFFNERISTAEVSAGVAGLLSSGVVQQTGKHLKLTDHGRKSAIQLNYNYYFSVGIRESSKSQADLEYQNSKSLSADIDSIIDSEQFHFMLEHIESSPGKIFDLGSGRGGIACLIKQETGREISGVEQSKEMINYATRRFPELEWIEADINNYRLPEDTGSILLIDSLYFLKNPFDRLQHLINGLQAGGIVIVAYSEYSLAAAENITRLEEFIVKQKYNAYIKEFTGNEMRIWEKRKSKLLALFEKYSGENNEYLFYDKFNEARGILGKLKAGKGKRIIAAIVKGT